MLSDLGALSDIIAAGARILESACGPCIGMGQAPKSGGVSLRTFNRNFEGRSGTADAQVYLVSPETAAISAITGVLTDPQTLGEMTEFTLPSMFKIDDNMIIPPAPAEEADKVEIVYGPNIKEVPKGRPLEDELKATVVLKVEDNITADTLCPRAQRYFLPLQYPLSLSVLLPAA